MLTMPMTLSRSLLTVVIPGAIAVSPWALLLVQYTDATLGFDDYPTIAHTLFFSSIVVAGVLCETFGSFMEDRWDRAPQYRKLRISSNFYDYLSKILPSEPVAFRYLSRLVTALYFELAMIFAAPLFLAGCAVLAYNRFPSITCWIVPVAMIISLLSFWFFHWQARTTHRVINITRYQVMKRLS